MLSLIKLENMTQNGFCLDVSLHKYNYKKIMIVIVSNSDQLFCNTKMMLIILF